MTPQSSHDLLLTDRHRKSLVLLCGESFVSKMKTKLLFTLFYVLICCFCSSSASVIKQETNLLSRAKVFFDILKKASAKFDDQECVRNAYPPDAKTKVEWEVINLDLSPRQRYNDLAAKVGKQMYNFLHYVKNFTKFIDKGKLFGLVDKDLAWVAAELPDPYGEEIVGIHEATGIPLGEIVLYNIFYEVFTVCTSIVAEDKKGTLYHARNLDFGLFLGWDTKTDTWGLTEVLRPLVVNLDYQKGGKTVYQTISFAGYVGVLSGMKPGVLTLTLNERFNINGGYIGIIEWLLGKRSAKWDSFLTRDVLSTATSFAQAREMLMKTEVLAPVYYILGGNKSGEGVVITRSRTATLNQMSLKPSNGTWYVLETNYDPWKPPLFLDDRRTPGKKCMNKIGQNEISFKELFNVLSTQPVLNKLTTYTALMQVNSGNVETYIRDCKTPCFPW